MNPALPTTISAGQMGWVSLLIFGFPVAMVLLGEAVRILKRERHRYLSGVRILRNWVIPALTVFVLLTRVMGLSRAAGLVRVAETLLWISLIYAALSLMNSVLFDQATEGSWQAKVPRLFRDLGQFVLVLLGSSIVLSTVWGADLGGFLTALGVGSLVLGLALQDSLGNIFSGVALLFEQPVRLGDWVEIGGVKGKVVEVNWRAVHLLTGNDDLLVVPNSELGKSSFTNMSRPELTYTRSIDVNFSLEDPPNRVKEILESTAREIKGVLEDPPPKAKLVSYNDNSISYTMDIACPAFPGSADSADELMRRLWYVARRDGLTMPFPSVVNKPYSEPATIQPVARQQERLRVLRNSSFALLPAEDIERLATSSLVRDYAAGEVVMLQGTPLTSLLLLLTGEAEMLLGADDGSELPMGILSTGEFFGERVTLLYKRIADTTVRAATDLRVLVIDGTTLGDLLDANPRLAKELTGVMDIRQRAMESLKREHGGQPTRELRLIEG
jgi:small-conductance mechanosensitive channel